MLLSFIFPPTHAFFLFSPHRNRGGLGVSHWLSSPVPRPESRLSHLIETASSYPTPLFLSWSTYQSFLICYSVFIKEISILTWYSNLPFLSFYLNIYHYYS